MLLGRDGETLAIERALQHARAGASTVLAVVGEAGIGKSAMLDWAADQAGGMRLLRARGVESEAHIPFAGLFELLRPGLAGLARLPRPQAAALESALALRPPGAHDRFAIGAATLALLASLAESEPVLVMIDDAHWLDGSSADALRFALRRLEADPITVLLTVRSGHASLLDGADFARLELAGLDPTASAELARSVVPGLGGEAATRLIRETGGNPLALLELAAAVATGVPPETPLPAVAGVASAYQDRLRELPETTRALLLLAAAGDRPDLALLSRAAARAGWALHDLAAAERLGLISLTGGSVEFRHPLARSAVYETAPAEDRRNAHRLLADALPDAEADRRAWHLALAAVGPSATACSALTQAADRAARRGAYEVASQAHARAAGLAADPDDRAALLIAAADNAWLGGRSERARELLETARHETNSPRLLRSADRLRGQIALRLGPIDDGRRILVESAERAAADDPTAAVTMLADAAEAAFHAGDAEAVLACGLRAVELAAAAGDDRVAAFFAEVAAGMGEVLTGRPGGAGGRRAAGRPAPPAPRAPPPPPRPAEPISDDPRMVTWAAVGPLFLRESTSGEAEIERAAALARAGTAVGVLPHVLLYTGIARMAAGRYAQAEAAFDESVRLGVETGQRTIVAGALARLAWVEARTGRADDAERHAAEALVPARETGAHVFAAWAFSALAELELAAGNPAAARERLLELERLLAEHGIADADLSPAPELVDALLRLGKPPEAAEVAHRFAELAAAKRLPWAQARAERCLGQIADEGYAEHFERAASLHARTADRFELARTQFAHGARLRRDGRRVLAREQLRPALESLDALGAAPWAELARTELAATGETVRRRDPRSLDELTPQELRVSLLLAEGRTTREAAAALYLSPKTVEYHLHNAYRKLGVRSRDELATALAVANR